MNLPFFKNFNKKIVPLYFLVLVLRDEKAEAVIFEEVGAKVKIIGQKEENFSTFIDEISQEELLEKLDKAISSAESSLPENIQTQKTIFGVKESWTDNDQIKKEYLAKLKKASEELGLIPIGFLVMSQAISHLLQKEEGAPVSAILAEINKKSVTVTLLRAGKSIETKSSEIHDSIPFTVDTLLKHFNIPEILPSRIIIFNGKEDLSQEFISHTWSKSLPFLHLPQITSLPEGFDAKSVLFGAATQMGFEVLEKDIPKEPHAEHVSLDEETKTIAINDEENPIERPTLYKNLGTQDFGFAKDVDVAKMQFQEKEEKDKNLEEELKPLKTGAAEEALPPQKMSNINNTLALIKSILFSVLGILLVLAKKINIKNILSIFTKAPKGKLTIIVPAILFLIIALIASYFLFLKATITITVDPKITEKTQNVLFSTKTDTDPSKNIIKGDFVTVSEEDNVSTPATGKKDIGTNAKGTVTIFASGSISQNKTLAKGTILKSPNGLEFTLDSPITIASHSADAPFSINGNVTANQLGKESNLPSGTKFSVDSYETSDLVAKNDSPFSGGTKKEVTVVSKDDSAKLETDLLKLLENKAKEDLQGKLDQNKILLPKFITENLGKRSLNAKVGDEASQVTLTGTVDYQGLSYSKDDLIKFSKSLLSKDVPINQEIDYSNIKTDVLDMKNKNDEEIEANFNIKTILLPKIDEAELVKKLKGKSFKTAENVLYKLSQISNVDISFSPKIPFLPKNLPAIEKNIRFSIKING